MKQNVTSYAVHGALQRGSFAMTAGTRSGRSLSLKDGRGAASMRIPKFGGRGGGRRENLAHSSFFSRAVHYHVAVVVFDVLVGIVAFETGIQGI